MGLKVVPEGVGARGCRTACFALRGLSRFFGHHPDDGHQSRVSDFRERGVRPLRKGGSSNNDNVS